MEQALESLRVEALAYFQSVPGFIILAITLLVFCLGWCRLFAKAGFHGATGVLMLVPGLNVLLFLWLALAPWPTRRKLRDFERMQRLVHRTDRRQLKRSEVA